MGVGLVHVLWGISGVTQIQLTYKYTYNNIVDGGIHRVDGFLYSLVTDMYCFHIVIVFII